MAKKRKVTAGKIASADDLRATVKFEELKAEIDEQIKQLNSLSECIFAWMTPKDIQLQLGQVAARLSALESGQDRLTTLGKQVEGLSFLMRTTIAVVLLTLSDNLFMMVTQVNPYITFNDMLGALALLLGGSAFVAPGHVKDVVGKVWSKVKAKVNGNGASVA